MGYTHHWTYTRDITPKEWQKIRVGFDRLVGALPNIPLAGLEGEGEPEITTDYLIFNGRDPNAFEPFDLFRTRKAWAQYMRRDLDMDWFGFCKTIHLPYDLAVMCTLLLVNEIAPGALEIGSDGDMEGEAWGRAQQTINQMTRV